MRLKHTIQLQVALDTTMRRALFKDDPTLSQVVIDTYAGQSNSILSVEPLATEPITFGDVTLVRGLYLEVDGEAKVYLNGEPTAIQMKIAPEGTKAKLFVEAEVTALSIENTSDTATLTGVFCCWGDPV